MCKKQLDASNEVNKSSQWNEPNLWHKFVNTTIGETRESHYRLQKPARANPVLDFTVELTLLDARFRNYY